MKLCKLLLIVLSCAVLRILLISISQSLQRIHRRVAWLPELNHVVSAQIKNGDGQEIRHARAAAAVTAFQKRGYGKIEELGVANAWAKWPNTASHGFLYMLRVYMVIIPYC